MYEHTAHLERKKTNIHFTLCILLFLLFPLALGILGISARVLEPLLVCGYDVIVESLIKL